MTLAETTTIRTVLWWAVLVSCHAFHATAAAAAPDHGSVDKPYKRLAFKGNTTVATESISLPHSSIAISSLTPSTSTSTSTSASSTSTRAEQGASPPQVPSDAASDTSVAIPGNSLVEQPGVATSTSHANGEIPAAQPPNSDARASGGTFIASITTLARPPLATPPPTLASQPNSTSLAFPTFPPNTTNNVTTTKGQYTNSSTTAPLTSPTAPPTTTEDFCTTTSPGLFSTVIEYSIIHTWTITWYGDPADYTPPFPPISTPKPCAPTTSATGRFTISVCDSSGQSCSLGHTTDEAAPIAPSITTGPWWFWLTETSAVRGMEPTLTFVTTDKNPAVVFPTSSPPDYGGSPDPMGNVHSAAYPNEVQSSDAAPGYGNEVTTNQNVRSAPITSLPPVTVIVQPSEVIINDRTFTNNPTQPTSTVVVDGNTFTIDPTQVVGVGATVTRPPDGGMAMPRPPTITTVDDIGVDIEDSSVIIDTTTFTIGPKPTTVVVKGQTITLGPGAIAFPSHTLAIPAARDTSQVVFGAELITAIGPDRVVIEGTTITYGPPSSRTLTSVIDGDTILIGPSGVIAHGETYGGPGAAATATQFAAVGGVTISQVGPTALVIHGITYTLDPVACRTAATTTVLGGETVTVGPAGVSIGTWTLDQPYASTATTVIITPSSGPSAALPTATATGATTATAADAHKENGSPQSLASRRPRWALTVCIATGAGVLGAALL
ncbi:hypothetical protein F4825DRAFT_415963 [Nemania diffusa]|nr:hypothetical protein F4825DRAFT_415963 [Nemania diffusa]